MYRQVFSYVQIYGMLQGDTPSYIPLYLYNFFVYIALINLVTRFMFAYLILFLHGQLVLI